LRLFTTGGSGAGDANGVEKGNPGADILRHTFGLSWLAIHKNRPLLAEIMGNSVPVITKDYKRTMSLEQAEALFAILPPAEPLTA